MPTRHYRVECQHGITVSNTNTVFRCASQMCATAPNHRALWQYGITVPDHRALWQYGITMPHHSALWQYGITVPHP
jgi:hypothetical protein